MCPNCPPGPKFHLSKTKPQSFPQTCSPSGGLPTLGNSTSTYPVPQAGDLGVTDDKSFFLSPVHHLILGRPPPQRLLCVALAWLRVSAPNIPPGPCTSQPPTPPYATFSLETILRSAVLSKMPDINTLMGPRPALSIELKPLKGQ